MNFSSQRNLGKFTANLKETQLCYLQIPICNVVITIIEKTEKFMDFSERST